MINPKDILLSNHEAWLQNPVTQYSKQQVEQMIENCVNWLATNALNKEATDSQIRLIAAQVKILKQLKLEIYDTSQFIARTQQS